MTRQPDLNQLSANQLRVLTAELMATLAAKDRALVNSNTLNDKLTLELAILKRHKFARRSEQSNALQGLLLDELVDSDLAAIDVELEQAMAANGQTSKPKQQPKRTPLPPELPRNLTHQLESTHYSWLPVQARCPSIINGWKTRSSPGPF
jgi:hypothetical protein